MRIALLIVLALAAAAVAGEAELPVIVDVAAPPRLGVGMAGEIRLVYRAPLANVVAVVQATEDIDGPAISRSTREREFGVVARAFGREAGEMTVPVAFSTAGWKRITLTLVTDERERSEPAVIEIEVVP
ncbi:MAG: hypothetical protein HY002_13990 [Candidatus Rokubacteria bacterium]|nr:hypothetical protein [Candidatus Rokubacteria bacterium]